MTWLYGPLHTAVDWTPPPKAGPESANRTSALDLTTTTYKPILKHRSISELLTSELPTSPIFTPAESDEDNSNFNHDFPPQLPEEVPEELDQPRPSLTHTKSDTHIMRWGASRAFRKESPPRIDPPAGMHGVASPIEGGYSSSNLRGSAISSNPSSDSCSAMAPPVPSSQTGLPKKKHISFNTFVEQCIAIEKPKSSSGYEDNADDDDREEGGDDDERDVPHPPNARNMWGYDDG